MKIFWTLKALEQHKALEGCLKKTWTNKELAAYLKKLERTIDMLKKFPDAGISIGKYKRFNVTSQTALIYTTIDNKIIIIMMVWDNRRKPIF
ncbi:MAG: type II toxin-antitoxin system RelE/ParE family toxin [Candidatus Arcticimaribacter sp.]